MSSPERARAAVGALAAVASALLAACAGVSPPSPLAPPSASVVEAPRDLGRSEHVAVVMVQPGDTAATLAARELGDARQAWRVQPLPPATELQPGGPAVIALRTDDYPPARLAAAQRVPVLCYHRFTAAARSGSAMEVTARDFAAQLDWLERSGRTVVRLEELRAFLDGRGALPPKAVVITVDDGYRSAYDVAFPLLKARGVPFTLFLYTDYITGRGGALGWPEVDILKRSGLADLEAHTRSHPDLTRLPTGDDRRLAEELGGSRAVLQARVGGEVGALAYPYGAVNARVLAATRQAGFRTAATVKRGPNPSWADPLLLRRSMVLGSLTLPEFARLVDGGSPERP